MMNNPSPAPNVNPKLILRGIHISLTDAMRLLLTDKAERLFRHEPRIDRIRIDIDHDATRGREVFVAKGHIEIGGPDLVATVTSDDAYKAADLLIQKLDRMVARRTSVFKARRHREDRVVEPAS